jgi:hypothetical protein
MLTGCGTIQNFYPGESREPRLKVYGGVKRSVASLQEALGHDVAAALLVLYWPVPVGDIILSAVGDTVTLPVTICAEVGRCITAAVNAQAAPPAGGEPSDRSK